MVRGAGCGYPALAGRYVITYRGVRRGYVGLDCGVGFAVCVVCAVCGVSIAALVKRYDITFRGVGRAYQVSPPALDMRYAICGVLCAVCGVYRVSPPALDMRYARRYSYYMGAIRSRQQSVTV